MFCDMNLLSRYGKMVTMCIKSGGADPVSNVQLAKLLEQAKQACLIPEALEIARGAAHEIFHPRRRHEPPSCYRRTRSASAEQASSRGLRATAVPLDLRKSRGARGRRGCPSPTWTTSSSAPTPRSRRAIPPRPPSPHVSPRTRTRAAAAAAAATAAGCGSRGRESDVARACIMSNGACEEEGGAANVLGCLIFPLCARARPGTKPWG